MRMGRYMVLKAMRSSATAVGVACLLSACSSTLPSQYIHQAEPGVTLTMLVSNPDRYRDKVVILGGVIVEEKHMGDHVFLRLRNRPLDKDYMPHRPPSLESPEAGHYWVMMRRQELPADYHAVSAFCLAGIQQPQRLFRAGSHRLSRVADPGRMDAATVLWLLPWNRFQLLS